MFPYIDRMAYIQKTTLEESLDVMKKLMHEHKTEIQRIVDRAIRNVVQQERALI